MLTNTKGRGIRHHLLVPWGLAMLLGALPAATLAAAPPACGCAEELDSLVQKVEADYIGFHLALPTLNRARYEASKAAIRRAAAAASDEDCFQVLRAYVTQFHDGHLFLSEQPELSAQEKARLAASAETLPWTEESVRSYLDRNAGHLDPVEGIWFSDSSRFGIVRERQSPRRDFVSSPDQITYFQQLVRNMQPGSAWEKRFVALVERMQREPGKVMVTDVWGIRPSRRLRMPRPTRSPSTSPS